MVAGSLHEFSSEADRRKKHIVEEMWWRELVRKGRETFPSQGNTIVCFISLCRKHIFPLFAKMAF